MPLKKEASHNPFKYGDYYGIPHHRNLLQKRLEATQPPLHNFGDIHWFRSDRFRRVNKQPRGFEL